MLHWLVQLMQQVQTDPSVPQLQVMRKQVSRILQRFTSKRYGLAGSLKISWCVLLAQWCRWSYAISTAV